MNIEKLLFIKDYIINPPVEAELGFNMGTFNSTTTNSWRGFDDMMTHKENHTCGTVCCIGGLADAFWGNRKDSKEIISLSKRATKFLELSEEQAAKLFLHDLPSYELDEITPKQAADAIDSLIETGMPQWEDEVHDFIQLVENVIESDNGS